MFAPAEAKAKAGEAMGAIDAALGGLAAGFRAFSAPLPRVDFGPVTVRWLDSGLAGVYPAGCNPAVSGTLTVEGSDIGPSGLKISGFAIAAALYRDGHDLAVPLHQPICSKEPYHE